MWSQPKTTPSRSASHCEKSIPLCWMANWAAATPIAISRHMSFKPLRIAFLVPTANSPKSAMPPENSVASATHGKADIPPSASLRRMPVRPARIAAQKESSELPSGEMTLMPVITTRRDDGFIGRQGWRARKALRNALSRATYGQALQGRPKQDSSCRPPPRRYTAGQNRHVGPAPPTGLRPISSGRGSSAPGPSACPEPASTAARPAPSPPQTTTHPLAAVEALI